MPISREDVKHIARLARIELTESEEKKFEKELSAILEFVEKLNEINTSSVGPMTGGTTLDNVMRMDEQTDPSLELKSKNLMEAAPEKKEGWVKVRAVFE